MARASPREGGKKTHPLEAFENRVETLGGVAQLPLRPRARFPERALELLDMWRALSRVILERREELRGGRAGGGHTHLSLIHI